MKRVSQKITSLIMAFVVLVSTMSFTYDLHFCGDILVDVALFAKADSCGMEKVLETVFLLEIYLHPSFATFLLLQVQLIFFEDSYEFVSLGHSNIF